MLIQDCQTKRDTGQQCMPTLSLRDEATRMQYTEDSVKRIHRSLSLHHSMFECMRFQTGDDHSETFQIDAITLEIVFLELIL